MKRVKKYNPQEIEKKWQKRWYSSNIFKAKNKSKKKKFYGLVEFPYPSGEGLHVGHCRSYTAMDIIARKRRMEGFNVLFPIGWDAFGLPTENFAIKKGVHPTIVTKRNTDNFRRQLKSLGLSFDWSREINTTDPSYYKWTQWIFIQLFKRGLAYKAKMPINWCPSCKIGLANEEVINGQCERCGTKTEKREKEQWMIRITKYADRLIKDLEEVDYLEKIKIQQKEWIGRSEGTIVKFPIKGIGESIEVFTTRVDTIFSGTFLILSPGHPFIDKHSGKIENIEEILAYRKKSQNISEVERNAPEREITAIPLKGIIAINPVTEEEIPVWVSDFVLEYYGTGAVFGDAHDKRDFKMAQKYGIPLRTSIKPPDEALAQRVKNLQECYEGDGILYNSGEFDGLTSQEARVKITQWLEAKGLGRASVAYKLRDWVFSRQHYWGEPIPMVYCLNCGWQPIPEEELPLKLPFVKKYKPTDTGESPLSVIKEWVETRCPLCKGRARRETDTMPNWAGSNWYYLRYIDPKNNNKIADERLLKYWMPVDWYNGGMEHTTLHLLYSRFIYKFLWDIEAVPQALSPEPYKKRTSHGIILGEGGVKMSKSKGNVINPDQVIKEYGADTLRLYEMFMGPFDQMIAWDSRGIIGVRRFLEKIYNLSLTKVTVQSNEKLKRLLHKTIERVGKDIELMKFNTAISAMMEFVNEWQLCDQGIARNDLVDFLKILSPFAPHLAEELWEMVGFRRMCCLQKWPSVNKKLIEEDTILLLIQVNGKLRGKVLVKKGISQKKAQALALSQEKVRKFIGKNPIKKVIFVPDKLINIVI